jgi:hypothetical protein
MKNPFYHFARIALALLAIGCAFVAASYDTPYATATGAALTIAAFAAAPVEVSCFGLQLAAAAASGVQEVSASTAQLCRAGVRRLSPDPVTPPPVLVHSGMTVGNREVFLEFENFPLDQQHADQLARDVFSRCEALLGEDRDPQSAPAEFASSPTSPTPSRRDNGLSPVEPRRAAQAVI